jgi:hypothetical protein
VKVRCIRNRMPRVIRSWACDAHTRFVREMGFGDIRLVQLRHSAEYYTRTKPYIKRVDNVDRD